jgi:hypothetical protein
MTDVEAAVGAGGAHKGLRKTRSSGLRKAKTMSERPTIKPGDWIRIGSVDCVVSLVRPHNDEWGDCEVVFDPKKPTNADVKWMGEVWQFVEKNDLGGYADKYNRLRHYVEILKRGRP